MQALHARRGSITSEHSRGFLREFGRRAIAKALGERAALDDAKGAGRLTRGSRKLQVGRGGYEPPPPSPRPLATPALDCVGGEERERAHSPSHSCSSYCSSTGDVGRSDNAHKAAV